jgi:hypothetical protein
MASTPAAMLASEEFAAYIEAQMIKRALTEKDSENRTLLELIQELQKRVASIEKASPYLKEGASLAGKNLYLQRHMKNIRNQSN